MTTEPLQPLLPLLAKTLGHRPAPATIWRWMTLGIKSPNGRRIKLDAKKVGGKLYASPEALARFIQAQNPPAEDYADGGGERTPEQTRRLQEAGLL